MSHDAASESHRLTLLALAALEDLLAQAHIGPVSRTRGVRLALAWLQRVGIAEPWQTQQLWQMLGCERDRPDYEHSTQYIELVHLTGALDKWRGNAGIPYQPGDWSRHHRVRQINRAGP